MAAYFSRTLVLQTPQYSGTRMNQDQSWYRIRYSDTDLICRGSLKEIKDYVRNITPTM